MLAVVSSTAAAVRTTIATGFCAVADTCWAALLKASCHLIDLTDDVGELVDHVFAGRSSDGPFRRAVAAGVQRQVAFGQPFWYSPRRLTGR